MEPPIRSGVVGRAPATLEKRVPINSWSNPFTMKPLEIPPSTLEVLRQSAFRIELEPYAWVRAGRLDGPERHLVVIRDERETTVVTLERNLGDVEVLERNPDLWALLSIDCANPFYCVGFFAAITTSFAARGIDILALTTFTRDYFFVKQSERELARQVLLEVGIEERQAD